MVVDKILMELRKLEPMEEAGFYYHKRTGHVPDFFQIYFMIYSSHSKREEKEAELYDYILRIFHNKHATNRLPEESFLPEGVNIELQKLLRHIDIMAHQHDFFEVVCVLEGTCCHMIEQQEFWLHAGDITIIPPHLLHHLFAELDCICITIKIRTSTFDQAFSNLLQEQSLLSTYFTQNLYAPQVRSALTFKCGEDPFILEHLLYMYSQQIEKRAYYNHIIEGLMAVLFSYLLQNYQNALTFSNPITQKEQRIAEVLNYLRTSYKTATLKNTAKRFYWNPSYLSTSIHRFTGYTFSEIVRTYKLRRAAELLTKTKLKLDAICDEIGYKDTTQFIRSFKAVYGCTPHQYQKGNKQGKEN